MGTVFIVNVGAYLFISSFNKILEYLCSIILRVRFSAFSSVKLASSVSNGSAGSAGAPDAPASLDACFSSKAASSSYMRLSSFSSAAFSLASRSALISKKFLCV